MKISIFTIGCKFSTEFHIFELWSTNRKNLSVYWLIDGIEFNAVTAIFKPCNDGDQLKVIRCESFLGGPHEPTLQKKIQWNGPLRAKGVVILDSQHHLTSHPTVITSNIYIFPFMIFMWISIFQNSQVQVLILWMFQLFRSVRQIDWHTMKKTIKGRKDIKWKKDFLCNKCKHMCQYCSKQKTNTVREQVHDLSPFSTDDTTPTFSPPCRQLTLHSTTRGHAACSICKRSVPKLVVPL